MQQTTFLKRIRYICERSGMFAPDFTLSHLYLFIHGYEAALYDTHQPHQDEQFERFEAWLHAQHPEWRASSMWWGQHVLAACEGDLERTLTEIIGLVDRFLAHEASEPSRKHS